MIPNLGKLKGKIIFVTGGSRGIGKAIAEKCAKDGAKIVIAAKTVEPHPKLPGTIYSAAEDVERLGGKCLPLCMDVRDEGQVQEAVETTVKTFGTIDVLVNNASAISLTGTETTDMKKFDLMFDVNVRGTYLCSKYCIPYLKNGDHSKILNISPPLNVSARWFKDHCAYTISKYGMSMCVLGMAEELKQFSISVNALWPKTAIYTAAMEMLGGGEDIMSQCRRPEIVSDAAYAILTNDEASNTGNFYIDEDVLNSIGVNDMQHYGYVENPNLLADLFLESSQKVLSDVQETQSAPPSDSKLHDILNAIRNKIDEDSVKKVNATYLFHLKDQGTILLDLKHSPGRLVEKPEFKTETDVTFTLDADDFLKLFTKALNPTAAYMTGKLKIKGDLGKAMKLESFVASMD